MSAVEGVIVGEPAGEAPSATTGGWWARVEALLVRIGDRINPILVKETRQALKSKHFTVTFGLLLLAAWIVSLGGVLWIGQGIYLGARGPDMFFFYYWVLMIPMIVVPFSAFRSLASEREDGTYELLSITTLSSRQVISGKLGSAFIQLLIYGSAISPCLAFTYLLRGIELPTILLILTYTFLSALGLSLLGLFFATLTGERHWQVVLSVLLIMGLLIACWIFLVLTYGCLYEGIDFRELWFWYAMGMIFSAYAGLFASVFLAACAQINFASSNRSTALRITSLAHCLVYAAWISFVWIFEADGEIAVLAVGICFAALYWFGVGALMTGEEPELSLRVRRKLPQSYFGRVFLTWLAPGPGTGYIFAVSSLLGLSLAALAGAFFSENIHLFGENVRPPNWRPSGPYYERSIWFIILSWSYVTFYLGMGRGLIGLARKVSRVSPHTTLLIQVLLVVMGVAGPLLLEFFFGKFQSRFEYSVLHAFNPLWTLVNIMEGRVSFGDMVIVQMIVPGAALLTLLFNFPSVAEEVRRIRIAAPKRVLEEEALEKGALKPVQPVKTNPWD